jgi:ubiquitin-protein ligase
MSAAKRPITSELPAPKRAATSGPDPALQRLAAELKKAQRAMQQAKGTADEFVVGPVDESDMFAWEAELRGFEKSGDEGTARFGRLLDSLGLSGVKLGIAFPRDYPARPPFVWAKTRLRAPFVFQNGGMCMQLLSSDGWSPATTVQTLLTSVRSMWIGSDKLSPFALGQAGSGLGLIDERSRADAQPENTEKAARKDFSSIMSAHPEWFGRA